MEKNGFNITTDVLKNMIHEIQVSKSGQKFVKEHELNKDIQLEMEKEILSSFKICPGKVKPEDLVEKLPSLDVGKFKKEITDKFYNPELMRTVACITSSFTIYSGENSLTGNERIREFVGKLKQIGTESASGYALSGKLKNGNLFSDDFFVIKAPRSPIDANELIHESMVAFYGTNPLRKKIPNFAYVYGVIKCSPPFINTEKEVITWCDTNKSAVAYAIYENISSEKYKTEDFESYCKYCKPQEFLEYYLQTMLALKTAEEYCGFSHDDLHSENVLLRKVSDKVFYIPYKVNGKIKYMKTNGCVSTIIDYGMSHIQLKKDNKLLHFGHLGHDLSSMGVNMDACNPITDVYKFLCFCLYSMCSEKDGVFVNKECFDTISPLLKFFNKDETAISIMLSQKPGKTFFAMPLTEETKKFKIGNWISHVHKFILSLGYENPLLDENNNLNLLNCSSSGCKNFEKELNFIGIDLNDDIPVPKTFLQFYDSMGSLEYKDLMKERDELGRKFAEKLEKCFEEEKERIENFKKNLKPFIIYRVPRTGPALNDKNSLELVKNSFTKSIEFLDSSQKLKTAIKVGRSIQDYYKIQDDSELNLFYNNAEDALDISKDFKRELVSYIEDDIKFLKKLGSENRNRKTEWYFSTFLSVESLF